MGVGGQHHASAALPPGRDPVPIIQESGWAPGRLQTSAKNLAHSRSRSPDRPARSESPCRLSYPVPLFIVRTVRNSHAQSLLNVATVNPDNMSTGNLSCSKSEWKVLQLCFRKLPVKTSIALQIAFENFVEPSQNLPLKFWSRLSFSSWIKGRDGGCFYVIYNNSHLYSRTFLDICRDYFIHHILP